MSNINRIFLKSIGCFLSIFLVVAVIAYFVKPNEFYYNIIYNYYYDYNQPLAAFELFIFLDILYIYILRFFSADSNKVLINFVVSAFVSMIVTLILNNCIYENTDYSISTYYWLFCIMILISEYLFDRFLYKEYEISFETEKHILRIAGFLFFGALVFSRVYWFFLYFEDYKAKPLMIFNIFENFNEAYLKYFMEAFIIIYAVLCAVTFLLFVIVNLSTIITRGGIDRSCSRK